MDQAVAGRFGTALTRGTFLSVAAPWSKTLSPLGLDVNGAPALNAIMRPSPHVSVHIDLDRIIRNCRAIKMRTGVELIAVVKADAYGLGIDRVAPAIAAEVDGFCVFSLREAGEARLWERTRRPVLVLAPEREIGAEPFMAEHARPAVCDLNRAEALRQARPVLSVDTGMQRFACPIGDVRKVLEAGGCDEAFTHATRLGHVQQLLSAAGDLGLRLHAAGSSLLDEPLARLDAVRPGRAIYEGAVRVTTPLVETHLTHGSVGYSGFSARRHGIILAGYTNGLRPGPCLLNDRVTRVIEVGMQSAYVELTSDDAVGDSIVLLGDVVTESEIALAWETSEQEVLVRLSGCGERQYTGPTL